MRRILLLCVGARALVAPGPARARRALRHAFDGDGFATSSDSFDVMDDEGWIHEGEERDAGVTIHSSMDCAEEPVDVSTYFFGNEDDDAELRRLLGELEAEFAGEADAASASILDSVRSCHEVLDGSAVDFELDARAALAFAATARGDAPADEVAADAAPVAAGDAALAEAYAANAAHEDEDDAYSWLLGNATAAARGGAAAASGFGSMGSSVGIDLGTTNSAAAAVDASGAPRLLTPLVPSVVCFVAGDDADFEGRVALRDDEQTGVAAVVGHAAEALRGHAVHGASVCSRVKRILARDATLKERRRVGALEDSRVHGPGVITLKVPALPARVAAAEVSAEVVRKLRDDAIACLAEAGAAPPAGYARRAVVGVPARFDDAAREATITAARLGGFDAVHLITEPEAAALAYGSRVRGDGATQRVLVFDLGGGTFDASVVLLADANATLASLGGDAKLGGDDFDAALAEHLSDRFYDAHGLPVAAPTARLRLLAEAERVKHALSSEADVVAGARGLARVGEDGKRARGGRPLDLEATVSRRLFEALCAPLLARLEATTRDVCEAAGVALPGDGAGPPLDSVLLVGGATRMPAVGRLLRRVTGLPLAKIVAASEAVSVDEAVALGCAIRAAALDVDAALAPREAKPAFELL